MKKFTLVLAAFLFLGCAPKNNQIITQEESIKSYPQIEISRDLSFLKPLDLNIQKRSDGMLEFELVLLNTSSLDKDISYKTTWKNLNGFTIDTLLSRFEVAKVQGNRKIIIHKISPSDSTGDFILQIQKPNSIDEENKDSYHRTFPN